MCGGDLLQVPIVRGDLKTALRGLNMKIAKHGIETSLKLDRIPKPFAKRKAKEPLAWRGQEGSRRINAESMQQDAERFSSNSDGKPHKTQCKAPQTHPNAIKTKATASLWATVTRIHHSGAGASGRARVRRSSRTARQPQQSSYEKQNEGFSQHRLTSNQPCPQIRHHSRFCKDQGNATGPCILGILPKLRDSFQENLFLGGGGAKVGPERTRDAFGELRFHWCLGPESNRYGTRYRGILSPLRLPFPPPRLWADCARIQGRSQGEMKLWTVSIQLGH